VNTQNIFSLLIEDHNNLLYLVDKIDEGRDFSRTEKLLSNLRTELLIHCLAEEEILYPFLKGVPEPKILRDVEDAKEEGIEMKAFLSILSSLPVNHKEWQETFDRLSESVERHNHQMGTTLFDKMRAAIDEELLEELAQAFLAARERIRRAKVAA
jgi:iron-sulfur cluster repair protein YtfE (RIC family)